MTGTPPPASDDEIERRLAAIKAGADPGSTAAGSPRPGPAAPGGRRTEEPPALVGEVIDDAGREWAALTGAERAGAPPRGAGPGSTPRPGPGVRAMSWGISQAQAGRLGLWIGLALVVFGGYLVFAEFVPGISLLGSLALAILGVVLVGWHLAGRAGGWAVHAGVILGGFGIARVASDLANLPSAGWGTLGAGLGLLLIALVRLTRGEGIRWQAWVGGALAIWGGWGALGATIPGFPTLGDLIVPLVLVLIGVAVLRRGFRPAP